MQKQSVVPAFKYLKITTHVNSSVRVVSTYEGDSNNALKIRELEFDSFSARLDGCGRRTCSYYLLSIKIFLPTCQNLCDCDPKAIYVGLE